MTISIMVNGFYGNRTLTEIESENFDRFMLGHVSIYEEILDDEKIDRTIIKVPNTKNSVFVYNKYKEEEVISDNEYLNRKFGENYKLKPTLIIGETKIYSRVIVCGLDDNGCFTSVNPDDYDEIFKYLSK